MKVATIGYFDGVHVGHKKLIDRVIDIGRKYNLSTVVYTFDFNIKTHSGVLMTMSEKISALKSMGIDEVVVLNFEKIRDMTKYEFVDSIKKDIAYLVVGKDFRYGTNREGDIDFLRDISDESFFVEVIDDYVIDGQKISSSIIRDLVVDGKIDVANSFMLDRFSVSGTIVKGYRRGTGIGFPTANILWPKEKLKPAYGVYFTKILLEDKEFFGMTMIGVAKTFNENFSCETNIFNFSDDIYGSTMKICFCEYLRTNIKFSTLDELRLQLYKDKINCLNSINNLYKKQ